MSKNYCKKGIVILKVLLLALNAKFIHSSLALRYIKAYCKPYEEQIQILESSINNDENELIKEIYKHQPDILGISCYIWNMSFIKTLIPTLKKILPQTTFILGGPEVSYDGEYLLKHLKVDYIMEGEGEETWKDFLDYYTIGKIALSEIDGLVYRKNDRIVKNKPRQPLNLEKLPFVYDSFEGLEHKLLYYEASRGCPFNCQYCLSSVEKGVRFVPLERVKAHLNHFLAARVKQVKFVDRTFNTRKDYAMAIWKHIMTHDNGYTNFHFEIAAELIDDEMIDYLKDARPGLIQFEIGVQSTNLEVLTTIKRKMPYEEIKEVVLKIKKHHNIHQHLDLIAGLPYEDYASFRQSFNDVMALRPEQFQLGFLKLLKGSGLRKNAEQYGLVYKEEPPYEILYTRELNYAEMLKLHSIEEMVERYYNSERFKHSLEYLFTCFNSNFDFFEALAVFWEQKGYDQIQHNKMAYYKNLIEFGTEKENVNEALLKEWIRLDYMLHEMLVERQTCFETLDAQVYKETNNGYLRNEAFIETQLPHLADLSPRQRFRKVHLEQFKYNLWEVLEKKGAAHDVACLPVPITLLFDYTKPETKCYLVKGEKCYAAKTTG